LYTICNDLNNHHQFQTTAHFLRAEKLVESKPFLRDGAPHDCAQKPLPFRGFLARVWQTLPGFGIMAGVFLVSLTACSGPGGSARTTLPQVIGGPGTDARVRSAAGVNDVVAINAGGAAVENFSADEDYRPNGTWPTTTTKVIDTSGVSNPAPQAVYQSARSGAALTYTIPGLTPSAAYAVRLDFAEIFWKSAAQRSFNIAINGVQVAANFDIFAAAGNANKAVALSYSATASSSGTIVIALTAVTNNAMINGIEISPGASPGPSPLSLNHVLVIGQSLSNGAYGIPALTTTQPFNNVMFNTGIVNGDHANATDLVSFAPLVESVLTGTVTVHGETGWAAAANLVTALTRSASPSSDYRMLISDDGASGYSYAQLMQGTAQYAVGLSQVKAAHAIAQADGFSHVVSALFVVHGEQDASLGTLGYESDLEAWQADYQSDIQAITGQTAPIPMFVSQLSGNWDAVGLGGNAALIPQAQLQASFDEPTKIYLVGPKYMLTFSNGPHLTNTSYRQMGEYFAKAYRSVVIEGKPWIPLRPQPSSITCTTNSVDVAFDVPVPPLVLDTTLVTAAESDGFSVVNGSGKLVPISAVTLSGPSTVHIALGATISGSNNRLQYAYGSDGHPSCPASALTCNGSQTGPRGNLRDSDSTPSLYGNNLYNWAVQFEEPCTMSAAAKDSL